MIPNRFHFIWMGKKFPYVNRLAVESLLLTNPEAEVTIHFSDPPENPHWEALHRLRRVEFRPIVIDELLEPWSEATQIRESLSRIAQNYPAGRSNILRYLILYRWGGVYLDFDVVVLRPFGELLNERGLIGEEVVFRADDERVQGAPFRLSMIPEYAGFLFSWGITRLNSKWFRNSSLLNTLSRGAEKIWAVRKLNNAVLGAEPEHPFFRRAVELIPQVDPSIRYGLGPILMNRIWDEGFEGMRDAIRRFAPETFYAVAPSQTHRFFSRHEGEMPAGAVLIHWCSSNEKEKAARLLPETIDTPPDDDAVLIRRLVWPVIRDREQLLRKDSL